MRTISFINNKGGVGKTSSVIHLGYTLSNVYKKRVLLVDLDPQRNASNFYLKTGFLETFGSGRETLERGASVEDLLRPEGTEISKTILRTGYENLDIIPCYPTLILLERELRAEGQTQFRLRESLSKVHRDYDFCLIDCSPSLSILNINALAASDEAFIPTLADDASLFGIEITKTELLDAVRVFNPGLTLGGIYFTRYRSYLNVSKAAGEILQAAYGKAFLPFTIAESTKVAESTYKHKPLPLYGKRSRAAQDFITLAGYIAAPNRRKYIREYKESEEQVQVS